MFDLTSIFQAVFLCFFVIASLRLFRRPSFIRFPITNRFIWKTNASRLRLIANTKRTKKLIVFSPICRRNMIWLTRSFWMIIERRPIYLRDLRRPGDLDTFGSQKDPKVWNEYRLNDYYWETELPENFQVSGYRYEQNPSGGQYRFFRQLTDHQFAYGLVFLLIVVLLILLLLPLRKVLLHQQHL